MRVSWMEQCGVSLSFVFIFFFFPFFFLFFFLLLAPVTRDAYNSAWGLAHGFYGRVMGPLGSSAGRLHGEIRSEVPILSLAGVFSVVTYALRTFSTIVSQIQFVLFNPLLSLFFLLSLFLSRLTTCVRGSWSRSNIHVQIAHVAQAEILLE